MKTDIFDKEPKIGDRIVFNPPDYKGLVYGVCIGFSKAGLPKVKVENISSFGFWALKNYMEKQGYYTPKTEFVIVNE
jgi:signal peptidase I